MRKSRSATAETSLLIPPAPPDFRRAHAIRSEIRRIFCLTEATGVRRLLISLYSNRDTRLRVALSQSFALMSIEAGRRWKLIPAVLLLGYPFRYSGR